MSVSPATRLPHHSQWDQRQPLGLYIHIPFCEKKCPYCDFNTYAKLDNLFDAYVDALCLEIGQWGERLQRRPLHTIFLGGGTPTVLEERALTQIFETVHKAFELSPKCEITSEANPGTVDRRKFAILRKLGVTRLSMGVQSFQPQELAFLGRIHNVEDVHRAFDAARQAGFDNINLDFIFGLPNQSRQDWTDTLARAIALDPEHLSLYSLIVEPETPLFHWVQSGRVDVPDDDQAGLLYEIAIEQMAAAGYIQYEVSNWAKATRGERAREQGIEEEVAPDFACQHNLIYWRNQEYIGVGPGAHSFLSAQASALDPSNRATGLRWSNRKPVPGYIKRMVAADTVEDFREQIDLETSMGETMMLGLRLVEEGVALARFRRRYAADLRQIYAEQIQRFTALGLMTVDAQRVRLTARGVMVGNQIFAAFLP
ncbi:MAG: radical SAM family heme chaperone HemW [Caldilineaceae bacterium]|nr:radical SAM family heme chaperone HemW [Caldilineaceae bacterium]